jgi:hypothetical protein
VIKDFFRQLVVMFPHLPDIKKPILYYKILKTINKRQPQKRFQQVLGPYTHHIVQQDERFFLDKWNTDNQSIDDIMEVVRKEWSKMNREQKQYVWQNLYKLMQLSQECEAHRMEKMKRLY